MNIKTVLKVISKVAAHISEKAEERRNAPRKPKMGDIIFCQRFNSLYKHFGVYIGNDRVIHFATPNGSFNPKEAVVHETSLEKFAAGDKVQIAVFPEERPNTNTNVIINFVVSAERYKLQSPAETVRRAKSALGRKGYNLITNNCESFATWCKTNVRESWQVNKLAANIMPA